MNSMANPLLRLELRAVDAPAAATPGARVYSLLPSVDQLLGAPGFGLRRPILLGGATGPCWGKILFQGMVASMRLSN